MNQQSLEQLKSHLAMIKAMNSDQADDEFFKLMNKAKDDLGPLSMEMAMFYYEYANFLLTRMEKNIDVFNPANMPREQNDEDRLAEVDEDSNEESGANQPPQLNSGHQQQGNLQHQDKDVTIREDQQQKQVQSNENQGEGEENGGNINNQNEIANNQNEVANNQNNNEGEDDQVVHENLQFALQIYLNEKEKLSKGQHSNFLEEELDGMITKARSRLGDLYIIIENYPEAVTHYRQVVEAQRLRPNHETNRGLAEIHYLIGNAFLYENKDSCQQKAVAEYINAVQILVNHLKTHQTQDNHYPIPTATDSKVDRIPYLPKFHDTDYTREMKDIISLILDKIQDTHDQIATRQQLEIEKEKAKKLAQVQNGFKEVPKDTPVINLGTFGNRKKAPQNENNSNGTNLGMQPKFQGNPASQPQKKPSNAPE